MNVVLMQLPNAVITQHERYGKVSLTTPIKEMLKTSVDNTGMVRPLSFDKVSKPSTPKSAKPSTPKSAKPSTPISAKPSTSKSAKLSTPKGTKPSTPKSATPKTRPSQVFDPNIPELIEGSPKPSTSTGVTAVPRFNRAYGSSFRELLGKASRTKVETKKPVSTMGDPFAMESVIKKQGPNFSTTSRVGSTYPRGCNKFGVRCMVTKLRYTDDPKGKRIREWIVKDSNCHRDPEFRRELGNYFDRMQQNSRTGKSSYRAGFTVPPPTTEEAELQKRERLRARFSELFGDDLEEKKPA